jgi:hypothetical protein
MPNKPIRISRTCLASHLIFTGYGHWLPNDPRGSQSAEIRKDQLGALGEIHFGRKRIQPRRDQLQSFHRKAEPLLDHAILWFDETMRGAIARAFGEVIRSMLYTCWGCAILRDHVHVLLRTHKDCSDEMWDHLAKAAGNSLRAFAMIPENHPIWSSRSHKIYLFSRHDVLVRIPTSGETQRSTAFHHRIGILSSRARGC